MRPTTKTKLFCVLATPASDLGGVLYNAGFESLNEDAVYLPLSTTELPAMVAALRTLRFSGAAVSMPYKEAILPLLDHLDPDAQAIGAVNTVVMRDGAFHGHNTDWYGAVQALKEETRIKGKSVLLIGAGGAARAIAFGIVKEGGELTIVNRSPAAGEKLATLHQAAFLPLSEVRSVEEFEIVINGTSVGFREPEQPPPVPTVFHPGQIVMDVVFTPLETQLLRAAAAANAVPIPGTKMLAYQARMQFDLWLGRHPELTVLERALIDALQHQLARPVPPKAEGSTRF
ncbi:MAG: shikimate dehydrogenase [Candidatus Aenigmarchaeota archaeon]|nr:shikimate dehydrogenase [Candidatus Aenigmarchaeota archaeon]